MLAKAAFVCLLLALPAIAGIAMAIVRSDFYTREWFSPPQPVQFSHRHHVRDVGLDCRYCHHTAETNAYAGIPATEVCMTCHSQLWTDSPMLAPVRRSMQNGEPLRWNRVNRVAEFVYFDHSIHVQNGVGCETCHGRVDTMALAYPEHTFHMQWCLHCHRNPEQFIRPKEHIFTMGWKPDEPRRQLGRRLVEHYDIAVKQLDDCTICHR